MFSAPEYQIIRNEHCGFTVQIKRWWFPFWYSVTALMHTEEGAREYAEGHAGGVVAHLGRWTGDVDKRVPEFAPLDAEKFGIAVMSMAENYVRDTPLATRQEHARQMGWPVPEKSPLNPDGHDDYYYGGR